MKHTDLVLIVPGAWPSEINRGLRAAQAVFDAAGVTPREAAMAALTCERWASGDPSCEPPSDATHLGAAAWNQARSESLGACCQDWKPLRLPAGLEINHMRAPVNDGPGLRGSRWVNDRVRQVP